MMNDIRESFAMLRQAKECNIFKSDSPLRRRYTQPVFRSKNNSIGSILNRMTYSGCFPCSAVPADFYYDGSVDINNRHAYLWSVTPAEDYSNFASGYYFYYTDRSMRNNGNNKHLGYSVRCVRD